MLCNEKSLQWEAQPPQLESSPHSLQLEKAHMQCNQKTKTQHNQNQSHLKNNQSHWSQVLAIIQIGTDLWKEFDANKLDE